MIVADFIVLLLDSLIMTFSARALAEGSALIKALN
jgi:hypothetical protein